MAFTVRTMEAYLDTMEVHGQDRQVILDRTRSFEEDGWVAGGNIRRILAGYPELEEELTQDMFNKLLFADPSLLTP